MRETRETEIDGLKFSVTQLPWRRQQKLLLFVTGKVLPAMGYALESGTGVAAEKLFAAMVPDDLEKWQVEMMKFTQVTTGEKTSALTPELADNLFQVDTGLKYTRFALEVNLGDFFTGLVRQLTGEVRKAMAGSPSTSTPKSGQPGDSSSKE